MSYVVVDIETTGLSRHVHKITEIAAARVVDGEVTREFQTLVNPQQRIPNFITRLTGIDNEMVNDAPTIQDILPAFTKFLGESTFVAHNAAFDYNFLSYNNMRCFRKPLKNASLCTKRLATRLLPELPSKRLGALCEHFNITNEQAHRALADVRATVGVLNHFTKTLSNMNITGESMLAFQAWPLSKCERIKKASELTVEPESLQVKTGEQTPKEAKTYAKVYSESVSSARRA